jgi:hypothetical protein
MHGVEARELLTYRWMRRARLQVDDPRTQPQHTQLLNREVEKEMSSSVGRRVGNKGKRACRATVRTECSRIGTSAPARGRGRVLYLGYSPCLPLRAIALDMGEPTLGNHGSTAQVSMTKGLIYAHLSSATRHVHSRPLLTPQNLNPSPTRGC